jgi:DNA-binding NarL/FixJ family response regulator
MRYPQIILFEADAAIAQCLEPVAQDRRWLLRQPRQAPACIGLLRGGGPAVLVIKIGRHLIRELTFLNQVHEYYADAPVVVVSDSEDYLLLRLAMELGASFVLMPPQSRQDLSEIVAKLMEASIRRSTLIEAVVDEGAVSSQDQSAEEPPLESSS